MTPTIIGQSWALLFFFLSHVCVRVQHTYLVNFSDGNKLVHGRSANGALALWRIVEPAFHARSAKVVPTIVCGGQSLQIKSQGVSSNGQAL